MTLNTGVKTDNEPVGKPHWGNWGWFWGHIVWFWCIRVTQVPHLPETFGYSFIHCSGQRNGQKQRDSQPSWSCVKWANKCLNIWLFMVRRAQKEKSSVARLAVSLVAQMAKNLPAMRETRVWALGSEDPLEKGMTRQDLSEESDIWAETRRPFGSWVVNRYFGSKTPKPVQTVHSEWKGKKCGCIPRAMGNQFALKG